MGTDFRRLQELRQSALPWQQRVADRMEPMLIGLAGSTTEAFDRLNQDRRTMPSPEYRDAIENVYSYAGQVNNLLSANLNYAQAREKLNRLDVTPAETAARVVPGQETARSTVASKSLEQRIKSELLKLPYYGVFDYLAFQVTGDHVTLTGHVSGPVLKTDAERAVGSVEGVGAVISNIEVLPLSPNDNRIRAAAYRAIYGHSTLSRYGMNPHPPIRIIVNNGNLVLMGVVGSDMDRTIAGMQAGSVAGAFLVTNHLQVGI
jgi:hyperosmotically inducible protein